MGATGVEVERGCNVGVIDEVLVGRAVGRAILWAVAEGTGEAVGAAWGELQPHASSIMQVTVHTRREWIMSPITAWL